MRFLVAPDKFKGSLSASAVAGNIARGIRDVCPSAEIDVAALADGGEGTAEVICEALRGEWISCNAHDAVGRPIDARYTWIASTATGVIDMSESAGLRRLHIRERAFLRASTFGVGEMMLNAAMRGAQRIVVGLGGSATNDGGFGMARALGFRFFSQQHELAGSVDELQHLDRIERADVRAMPAIVAAADVRNPLLGERGATRVFGQQKGGSAPDLEAAEAALTRLADVAADTLGRDLRDVPGAGAAGGLGFGLMTFCGAELRSGFELVSDCIGLEQRIRAADVVITGEGRLDSQTPEGKAPAGVARLGRACGKRVCAIVGEDAGDPTAGGLFDEVIPLARGAVTRTLAIKLTAELLRERAAELVARLV